MTKFASANTLTMMHGLLLVVVGVAILLGAYLRIAAIIASLIMVAILFDLITT